MRRRRALWRATHRGSKEMDYLLGRFTEQAIDSMNADDIAVLERLIDLPDPQIALAVYEGDTLGARDLDAMVVHIRRLHGFPEAS